MKKVTSIALIALFAIGFTSCKKDYTCECTLDGTVIASYTYTKVKKNDAESACTGQVTSGGSTMKCALK